MLKFGIRYKSALADLLHATEFLRQSPGLSTATWPLANACGSGSVADFLHERRDFDQLLAVVANDRELNPMLVETDP
jgi:hypothetical protein